MPLDFAGLGALSGTDNWAEIRQGKERDAQRVAILNAMSQQQNQKQQAGAQEVQDYLNTVGQIKVLDQDKQRIQAKHEQLQQTIQEGVKASHGNMEKYLATGGKTALAAYRNNLLESDEVQKGLMNSLNHNMATQAQLKGENLNPTAWKLKGAKEGDEPKRGEYAQNWQDFQDGKTDQLNFSGSYKSPKIEDPGKYFQSQYGNQEHTPGSPSQTQKLDYLINEGVRQGLSPDEAKNYARKIWPQYEKQDYQFKSDKQPSAIDTKLKLQRYEMLRNKSLQQSGSASDSWDAVTSGQNAMGVTHDKDGKEVLPYQNVDANAYNQLFGASPDEKNIGQTTTAAIKPTPLSDADKKAMGSTILGMTYNKGTSKDPIAGWKGNMLNGDKLISAVNFQPLKGNLNDHKFVVKDIDHTVVVPPPPGTNLPARKFALVHIDMPKSDADDLGIWEHHGGLMSFIPDRANKASEGAGRTGATEEGKLGRVFPILVPLDNIPLNLREAYTKKVKLGSLSNADIQDYMNPEREEETGE